MKKYSAEYYHKKFDILFQRLLAKEGFVDEIKKIRQTLGIPIEDGFSNSLQFANYLLGKMSNDEKEDAMYIGFMEQYKNEKKVPFGDIDRDDFLDYFKQRKKEKYNPFIIFFQSITKDTHSVFTRNPIFKLFKEDKTFSKLSSIISKIWDKYYDLDLLEKMIVLHFIEKYLFLGTDGVNKYIKNRIDCPSCRHIGIHNFSPRKNHMQGGKTSLDDYIFNKGTVKYLSTYFDSTFLIIKPYSTKDQVIQYVEDNWDTMKEHALNKTLLDDHSRVYPGRIKESDLEKKRLVYDLFNLPRKELEQQYREIEKNLPIPSYKESLVSCILDKKHDIKMSPDAVKKAVTRYAKSSRVTKEPLDIRDI